MPRALSSPTPTPARPIKEIEESLIRDALVLDRKIREGRFQRSLSLVAGASGLLGGLEVTLQHYRGSYGQRIMYTPVLLSAALASAGVAGAASPKLARTVLPVASATLLADGVIGFGMHIRGIHRKPGGWRIPIFNIVMGPPLFAPLLLGIGGFLGLIASRLRPEESTSRDKSTSGSTHSTHELSIREGRFQKLLATATAISAFLNGIESLYSHYKTRFETPAQWVPVLMTPPLIAASVGAVYSRKVARTWLPALSACAIAAGAAGTYYHLRGVARKPGGLKKLPLYNLVYGPPALAPMLFAATGFMGILASQLRRER
jgi:hypothetical protein